MYNTFSLGLLGHDRITLQTFASDLILTIDLNLSSTAISLYGCMFLKPILETQQPKIRVLK